MCDLEYRVVAEGFGQIGSGTVEHEICELSGCVRVALGG